MTEVAREVWSVSITELLRCFQEALLALVPVADKVRIPWREPENYDNWDSIATALYNSIVIGSVDYAIQFQGSLPISRYDIHVSTYGSESFIGLESLRQSAALVCLETVERPFDTCLFARLDDNGLVVGNLTVKFEDARFVVVARKSGAFAVLDEIEVLD